MTTTSQEWEYPTPWYMAEEALTRVYWFPTPDPNEDMVERDDVPNEPDPHVKRLHDLAEKAITQGQAQQAADAIEPIVSPKTDETAARNLGRMF